MDWTAVRTAGYYGVAFHFCNVNEIGLNRRDNKYYWHNAFDVESLCIFDLKAVDTFWAVKVCQQNYAFHKQKKLNVSRCHKKNVKI